MKVIKNLPKDQHLVIHKKESKIGVMVASQVNIYVQPIDAEAYEFPAQIASECQQLANMSEMPVILVGKNEDKHEFRPIIDLSKR